jgi:hypothetical protein
MGVISLAKGQTGVVQGTAETGPVCTQVSMRKVVKSGDLCIIGTGDTSVVVRDCRVSGW